MGTYRQHVTFATLVGTAYGVGSYYLMQFHWVYGSVAILLAILSGLLPDLDSDSAVGLRGFTALLGVLVAVAVWDEFLVREPPLPFEIHLWGSLLAFVVVRYSLRQLASKFTVHRGMSHSVPMCGIWGCLTYLFYPTNSHLVRLLMSVAVMLGFLSHLLLDEIFSVDLKGVTIKKSFGTALKFWSSSIWSTLVIYVALVYLTTRVIDIWPAPGKGMPPALSRSTVAMELPTWLTDPFSRRRPAAPAAAPGTGRVRN